MPLRPENPYGTSKMMVEQMLRWYGRIHGIRSVSLRYFNAAGASLDAALGEHCDKTMMLIPMLMKAALGLRGPVDIFGTDYPTPDGTAIRDYIHVVDLADAHIRALECGVPDWTARRVLNLGTGVGSSVKRGHLARRGGHRARGPGALGRPATGRCRGGLGGPQQRTRHAWAGRHSTTCGPWWRRRGRGIRRSVGEVERDRCIEADVRLTARRRRRWPARRGSRSASRVVPRCARGLGFPEGLRSSGAARRAGGRAAPTRSAPASLDDRAAPLGVARTCAR